MGSDDIQNDIERFAKAAGEMAAIVDRAEVVLVRFGNQKIMMVCGVCEGAFSLDKDGIRCRHCNLLLKVRWPDGVAPSLAEWRVYLLNHGAEMFGLDDLSDAA